ncbi:unnamed protein product [Spodoptera littoralis]|uniref:Ionotropic glutamate receptor C-terminal domain-containing protein n=1 Tax=Spodoptera littoralis TaxID=7109 RepID=A0A9P0IFL5_SPOLI|nr:unnamed protein product [Spodoptera littoralis]CAH1646710.1 unnamed protein product [Spodoptera littoralis]
MKCLSINGVASTSQLLHSFHLRANIGIIILSPRLKRNATENLTKLVNKLLQLQMDTSSYDWLITARSNRDFSFINEILNATSLRFDQNIIISFTQTKYTSKLNNLGLCDANFIYKTRSNWDRVKSMSGIEVPYPVEARNFLGEELVVGRCNSSGGTWTPSNPSGSMLLIVCLFFAVVTYNAYAAFITSVLSVRVASVDTIAAVLHSPNFKIGYIRNGADQMYLMSTKDVQLNAFYIRGYSDADNLVSSAEEGLARAASQDYAFFAGQRVARATLRSLSQARGRCAVRELPVHSTRAHLAFPLPRQSPYARPTLLSLLQLRSGGALARLEAALVPDMPQCAPPPGFASARATDVRSALILLIVGLTTSLTIGKTQCSQSSS